MKQFILLILLVITYAIINKSDKMCQLLNIDLNEIQNMISSEFLILAVVIILIMCLINSHHESFEVVIADSKNKNMKIFLS